MPRRMALTERAREDIQLEIQCGRTAIDVTSRFNISENQYYKMKRNLRNFGAVQPDPKEFSLQGRPKKLTREQEEGMVDSYGE